MYFSIEIMIY